MSKHFTNSVTVSGKPISYSYSDENVTAVGGLPFINIALKESALVQKISNTIQAFFPRSIFCNYSTPDLVKAVLLMRWLGFDNLEDAGWLNQDKGFKLLCKSLPSAATLSRWLTRLGNRSPDHCDDFESLLSEAVPTGGYRFDSELCMNRLMDELNCWLLETTLNSITDSSLRRVAGNREHTFPLILDFDSTFVDCYGEQEGVAFNGKKRANGYYPLIGFIQGKPIWIQNAPGQTDGRPLLLSCLGLILERVRAKFPTHPILIRADGGFNCDDLIQIAEKYDAKYLIGFGQNKTALEKLSQGVLNLVESEDYPSTYADRIPPVVRSKLLAFIRDENARPKDFVLTDKGPEEYRFCGTLDSAYRSKSWKSDRRLFYRVHYKAAYEEADCRFIQTNLTDDEIFEYFFALGMNKLRTYPTDCPQELFPAVYAIDLYDGAYSDRGNCERWIREFKAWGGTRMNSSGFVSNWILMFFSLAGQLIQRLITEVRYVGFGKIISVVTMRRVLRCPARIVERARNVEVRLPLLSPPYRRLLEPLFA